MSLVHYRAQRACDHIWKTPRYLLWRQYTALMPPPSLSARNLIWGPSRKNVQHLPNSPKPPYSGQGVGVLFHVSIQAAEVNAEHRLPSFFLTNTTALHQELWLDWIVPDSSISCRWFQTSSTSSGGICLNRSLKEASSVTFIVCSLEWVQPKSTGSNNTSWYLTRSWWAASASSGGQESNPLKSSSSNSFQCLGLTVNLGGMGTLGIVTPLQLNLHGWFGQPECCNCPGH